MENPRNEDLIEAVRIGESPEAIQSILESLQLNREELAHITEDAIYEEADLDVICTLIRSDPGVARLRYYGTFLLYTACDNDAPAQVTQLLLELNPDAAKETMPEGNGQLPLHLACHYPSTPIETIQLLLSHYPEATRIADDDGALPLHNVACTNNVDAIQLLIDTYPDAVRATSREGWLPLHYCCARSGSKLALQTLVENYSGDASHHNGLAVRDSDGRTPLHIAAVWYDIMVELESVRFLANCFPGAALVADNTGKLPLHLACSPPRGIAGRSLEHVRVLLDIDLFSILKVSHDGTSALEYSFGIASNRYQTPSPMPLEVRQFLREKQDEALRLMHESFEPAVVYFNLPDLVVATVWGFVLPRLWRPTDDEMNGA